MKDWAELLQAIAALLWPLVTAGAVLTFRSEIRSLLQRVRRGKLLGQEIELEERLIKLDVSANAAASEVHEIRARAPVARLSAAATLTQSQADDMVGRVLEEASRSPKAALLTLAAAMETELRKILLSRGESKANELGLSMRRSADILVARRILPEQTAASLREFIDVRNQLVHTTESTPDAILRAIDSGITLLNAIKTIPHEAHVVVHPQVCLYADSDCQVVIEGVHGVIIESCTPDSTQRRIFPTTRTHFVAGTRVAWEWDESRRYGRTWYTKPETGDKILAWDSSVEFVGGNLDEAA